MKKITIIVSDEDAMRLRERFDEQFGTPLIPVLGRTMREAVNRKKKSDKRIADTLRDCGTKG